MDKPKKTEAEALHYHTLIESSEVGAFGKDLSGKITSWDQGAEKIYGYTPEEMIGQPVTKLSPPDNTLEIPHLLQQIRVGQIIENYETVRVRKDGKRIFVSLTLIPIRNKSNSITGATTLIHDIAQKQSYLEPVTQFKEDLQEYIDSMSTMNAKIACDGTILMVNKAAQIASGLSREDLYKTNFLDGKWWTFDSEVHDRVSAAFKKAVAGELINYEERLWVFNQEIYINFSLIPMKDAAGNVKYIIAEGNNITAQKQAEAQLRESKLQLDEAQKIAHIGSWEWKVGSETLVWSDELYRLYGLRPKARIKFSDFIARIHPDDKEMTQKVIAQAIKDQKPFSFVHRIIRPDNSIRTLLGRGKVINSQEQTVWMIGTGQDITEQRKFEASIKESEVRFRKFFDEAPVGITLAKEGLGVVRVNKAFCDFVGYKEKEFIGKSFLDVTHPEDKITSDELSQALYAKKIPSYKIEKRYIHKSGKVIWANLTVSLVEEADGSYYALGMVEDITDRKQALEQLKESEERFSTVFRTSPIPIALARLSDNRFIDVNESMLTATGFKRDEIVGRRGDEINSPRNQTDPETEKKQREEFFRTGTLKDLEIQYLTKSGELRDAILFASLVELKGEKCVLILFQDITHRKELENRKSEFISIASHELKTPLTSTKAYTQLLKRHFQSFNDPHALQYLAKLEGQVNKLTELVNDLLDVTRIEAGKLILRKITLDINELVRDVVEDMQCTTHHQIKVIGSTRKTVTADRERIGQVLINFISNAIKYSPRADDIIVQIAATKKEIIVSVQDFGIGVAEDNLSKVFERFYRSDNRSRPGLGLGLYISKEIVDRHGGKMWVMSKIKEGSTFYFSLPITETKQKLGS